MRKKTCEICGYTNDFGDLVIQQIVPEEITRQAGILIPKTAVLCTNCSHEVQNWYAKKVSTTTYNYGDKRFVSKSPAAMVKEYEAVYRAFATYKKSLQNIA